MAIMSTSLTQLSPVSPSIPSDKTLGEVLDYLTDVKPHSIEFPAAVMTVKSVGNGAVAGLGDGKVVLVSGLPEGVSYLLETSDPHTASVCDLAVSGDQRKAISGADDGTLKFWDLYLKRQIVGFSAHTGQTRAVALDSEGLFGFSGGADKLVKVWDVDNKCELCTLEGHADTVRCIIVSQTNKFCISGDLSGLIIVWDLETRAQTATLQGHSKEVSCLALSTDEQVLWSGSFDCTVRAWNATDWTETMVFTGHTGSVRSLSLIQGGQSCISVSGDRMGKIWSLSEKGLVGSLVGHMSFIYSVAVSRDEKWCLTCSHNKVVILWDLETCTEAVSFQGHHDIIYKVVITQDNRHFITASKDKTVKIWSLQQRQEDKVIKAKIDALTVTKEHLILAVDKDIQLWNPETVKQVAVLQGHTSCINRVKVTSDQRYLLSCADDRSIKLWDLKSREEIHTFIGHTALVIRIGVSPDGKFFLSAGFDFTLKLWSIEDKKLLTSADYTAEKIYGIAVIPDCSHVVTGSRDGNIIIWTLPALKPIATLSDNMGICTEVEFLPDGNTILSSSEDKIVRLWSFKERRLVAKLYGHTEYINNMTVSKDGKFVATGSDDKTARVWSMEERREVACLRCHTHDVYGLSFTDDSSYLVTSSSDATVRITPFIIPWQSSSKQPLHPTSELVTVVKHLEKGTFLKHPSIAKTLLSPYNVNSLHISAYYNYSERCKEYLDMGVPFLKGDFGSPLTVSLDRRTIQCTDVFLKYLTNLAENVRGDSEWPVFVCIIDDIPALLGSGSTLLQSFFSILMQSPSSPPLPQFITPTSPLPIVNFSDSRLINIPDFDTSQKGELGSDLVKFNISLIRKNVAPGSTESLELMDALLDCEDKTVLNTEYVSLLIEQKWDYFYTVTLGLTLIYALMLTSLVMIIFDIWETKPLCCAFLAINLFLMSYEMAQMLASSCSYWFDPWNYVDICRGSLCLFWGVLVLRDLETTLFETDMQKNIRTLIALLCFLRGFTYFRSFRMTRLFVYMTIAVVKEMYSFLVIMAYSVFSFGVCTSILLKEDSLGSSWTSAFSLILGDFDSSSFGFLEWFIFMCAALINVIIMLNLLVSILGDAYEKTQMSVRENDLSMMLDLAAEYESLMFWRRNTGTATIMVSCKRSQEAEAGGDWAGQIVELKDSMKEEILGVKEKIAEFEERMEKKMQGIEGNMKGIEGKLEGIISLLSNRS